MDDEVVVHPAWWDADDPSIRGGRNPMLAPSAGIWSYDVANFGAFAQFTRAQDHQIFAQATSAQLGGGCGVVLGGNHGLPYVLRLGTPDDSQDDVVLVWGESGGVGSQAAYSRRFRIVIPSKFILMGLPPLHLTHP